jgi:hypothetical protein
MAAIYQVMTWILSVTSATAEILIWAVYLRHSVISRTFQRCNEILKVPKMHQLIILILLHELIKNINFKTEYACLYVYRKTVIQTGNTEYNLYEIMWLKKTEATKNNVFSCFAVITAWKISLTFILKGLIIICFTFCTNWRLVSSCKNILVCSVIACSDKSYKLMIFSLHRQI